MSTTSTEPTQESNSGPQNDENNPEGTPGPDNSQNPADGVSDGAEGAQEGDPETFTREYVSELREDAKKHRLNAKKSDELARRLVSAFAASSGRLHNADDVPFSEELLGEDGYPDPAKVEEAVTKLIESKPYLAKIRPTGDVGQHSGSENTPSPSAAFRDLLRGAAS